MLQLVELFESNTGANTDANTNTIIGPNIDTYANTKQFVQQKFLDDYQNECHNCGIGGYFGIMMIVTDSHLLPLITIAQKYMYDILGLKIPAIPVVPFTDREAKGGYVVGYYDRKSNNIHLRNNVHLHKLIPTVFHELTHAFIHNTGIIMIDNYRSNLTDCFDFEYFLPGSSQEEGFCELIMTLMQYHIFDIKEYPCKEQEYFIGWLLNIYAFMDMAKIFRNIKKDANNYEISRLSLNAMITFYKNNNNIYRFVNKVPKDAVQNESKIF